jgi:hypothetical protein
MIKPKLDRDAPKSLTKKARLELFNRQHGICPWCGHGLNYEDMHAHHRLLRGQGGTWDLANIVGLHGVCHDVQPGSVHQEPKRAYALGFMIRMGLLSPAQIPLHSRATFEWRLPGAETTMLPALALELIEAAGGTA